MIGALGRGRKRGNAVKGNVEYRSRAAARICRESPLTEWSATLAREGNGCPFSLCPTASAAWAIGNFIERRRNAIQQAAKLDHEKRRDNSGETIV